jgi:hypothetical protein
MVPQSYLKSVTKYDKISVSRPQGTIPHESKEERMSSEEHSPQERATRGKRLLLYGMFSLVAVTFVLVFLVVYLLTGPLTGGPGLALQAALIVSAVAIVACIIAWFVYTKLILKE